MNISIITFTENGTKLAEKIRQAFACMKTAEWDNAGNHDITKYGTVTIENRCKKDSGPLENNKVQTNSRGLSLSDETAVCREKCHRCNWSLRHCSAHDRTICVG